MKPICFLCLKSIKKSFLNTEETRSQSTSKFWNFAKEYLEIGFNVLDTDKPFQFPSKQQFCNDCENVVTSLSQLYLELLQAHLRLSSKVGELAKLLECSDREVSHKLGSLLINSLKEQLGFEKASQVKELRNLLKNKCQLKSTEKLPQVRVLRMKKPFRKPGVPEISRERGEVVKTEIDLNDLMEEGDNDDEVFENLAKAEVPPQIKTEPVDVSTESEDDKEMIPDSASQSSPTEPENSDLDSDSESITEEPFDNASTSNKKLPSPSPEEEFRCSHCSKLFPTRKHRYQHEYKVHSQKIPCPESECDKVFKTTTHLRDHLKAIHNPESHLCPHCEKVCKTKDYLRRHLKRSHSHLSISIVGKLDSKVVPSSSRHRLDRQNHHNWLVHHHKGKRFECHNCKNSFKSKYTLQHHMIAFHKPENHPCPHPPCKKSFRTEKYLKRHIEYVHNKDPLKKKRLFLCPLCPQSYSKRKLVDRHLIACAKLKNRKDFELNPEDKDQDEEKALQCPTCSRTYFNRAALCRHLLKCNPPSKQEQLEQSQPQKEVPETSSISQEGGSPCPFCGKMFRLPSRITMHIKMVHSDQRFQCSQCKVQTKSQHTLNRHVKAFHNPETHLCPFCPKTFKIDAYLKTHIRNVHEGKVKRFPCPHCVIIYTSNKKLEKHLEICNSEKPLYKKNAKKEGGSSSRNIVKWDNTPDSDGNYSCSISICDKVFTSAALRNAHVKYVHAEKVFTCTECGVTRKNNAALQRHLTASHKPKEGMCPHCGKTLATAYMVTHIKFVHPEMAPTKSVRKFLCPNCPERFWRKRHLEKHALKCSGSEPGLEMKTKLGSSTSSPPPLKRQKRSIKVINRVKNGQPLICEECGLTLKSNAGLRKHMNALHKPKDDVCPYCGKTMATGYMRVHLQKVHPELAPKKKVRFACPNWNCGEGFYTKKKLEKHLGECQQGR